MKNSVLDNFPPCPPRKAQILFLLSSRFLWDLGREEHSMDQCRSRPKLSELVHTFSWGNSYGPIIGPYLFLGKFVWTNGPESFSKVSPYTGIGPWMALPSWDQQRLWRQRLAESTPSPNSQTLEVPRVESILSGVKSGTNSLTAVIVLYPDPPILAFLDFLAFFLFRFSLFFFWCVLPFFSKDFRGSANRKKKTLLFWWVSLALFQKSKGWRVRVVIGF